MATDATSFRELSIEELRKEENGLREEVWKLRLQFSTGQLQNPHRVRQARRTLARVLTVLRERELREAQAGRR